MNGKRPGNNPLHPPFSRGNSTRIVLIFLILIFPIVLSPQLSCAQLTAQQERGKQIYFKGVAPSGRPVIAYFGKDLLELRGEGAVCSGCHGYDGLGRPESGVIPTNITWKRLMKSYGHIHPGGLGHPAFTEASLKSYMRDGIYPGGKKGDPSMPVYSLSDEDLDALISYLRVLGSEAVPGLSESEIRIGVVFPPGGAQDESGEAISKTILAYFEDVNKKGGIYNRRLKPAIETMSGTKALLDTGRSFALIDALAPDAGPAAAAETAKVPVMAAFAGHSAGQASLDHYTFYVTGMRGRARALAEFAATGLKAEKSVLAIIYPPGKGPSGTADEIEEQARTKGLDKVLKIECPPGTSDAASIAANLKNNNVNILISLCPEAVALELMKEYTGPDRVPYILVPGVLTGKTAGEVPANFMGKIYSASPPAQTEALVAAKVLVEGLRRSGRELDREKLINALEGIYKFDTGVSPPVTFGKNRRTGIIGAYIVNIVCSKTDKRECLSSGKWVLLE